MPVKLNTLDLPDGVMVQLDEARLETLAPAEQDEAHWRHWEQRAARASLSEPGRPLRFHNSEELEPCEGRVEPRSATYDARCGCNALPDQLLEEDVLYFDLYLSGEGPNVLFTHNFTGTSCREILLTSGAPAAVEETLARETTAAVTLATQVLRAPEGVRSEELTRLVEPLAPRLGECLRRRMPEDTFTGSLELHWRTVRGQVRELEVPDASADTASTVLEGCLRPLLTSWRLVALPPGAVSLRVSVRATLKPWQGTVE